MQTLYSRLQEDFKLPKQANLEWWKKEFKKIESLSLDGEQYRKMVARIKFAIFAAVYERRALNKPQSNEAQLSLSKKIQELIYPK